jgi:quercetin dioxygenase-like cupin family protein
MESIKKPQYSFIYDGVQINIYHVNKGEGLPFHTHEYSHATMCHAGSIVVRKENIEKTMTKESKPINLIGKEKHEIEALEDGTVFVNVFAEGKY